MIIKSALLFVLAVLFLLIAMWQDSTILYILTCCCIAIAIPLLPKKEKSKGK